MPYKSSKIKIAGTEHDRRIKLTPEQREEIKRRYETENIGMRPLAKEYGVDRGTIRYIVFPEKLAKAKEQFKDRRKDGRYSPKKEEWADIMKEHRKHKQKLLLEGKIELPPEPQSEENES